MKKFLFITVLLSSFSSYSQREVNYNFTVNFTFTHNENFGEYNEYSQETDWSFFSFKSFLLRNGLEVELSRIISVGINLGLDWHPDLDILAIPYYLDTKIAISEVDNDKFYVSGGIGKLLKLSNAFEKGNYYKIGLGYHIATEKSNAFILNLDFHQKDFTEFKHGKLNSLSLGFGLLF
ncbi:hypothetical protein [Lutibacter sp.]